MPDASAALRVVIMASGNGSNAENIIRHARLYPHEIDVRAIVCDKPQAFVVQRSASLGVPCFVVPFAGDKVAHEEAIDSVLRQNNAQMILLAGYMRILGASFVAKWRGKIVNIHPSLLPAFPGRDAYRDAFQAGVAQSGVTLHYVDEGVDTGPVIAQQSFSRLPEDTLEAFRARGMEVEYKMYRNFIDTLVEKEKENDRRSASY